MQGHIHKCVRSTKDGKQVTAWYVVVDLNRGPDGRRRQKWHGGFRTRREAEVAKAKLVNNVHTGTYIEPGKSTLTDWVESSWLQTMRSQVKASTWDSYMRNLRLPVLPRIGHRTLAQVTPTMLNGLYAELIESGRRSGNGGLSAKTVRYVHATVHKVLGDAVDAGLLQANPADRARPPKPRATAQTELRCWDAEQLAKFLAHIEGHRLQTAFHLAPPLAAMTGMRRGEVLGLRWGDVSFQTQRVSVRHTIISIAYQVRESTPKTHQARVVDLDMATMDLLRQHAIRQETERLAWGPAYQPGVASSLQVRTERRMAAPVRCRYSDSRRGGPTHRRGSQLRETDRPCKPPAAPWWGRSEGALTGTPVGSVPAGAPTRGPAPGSAGGLPVTAAARSSRCSRPRDHQPERP